MSQFHVTTSFLLPKIRQEKKKLLLKEKLTELIKIRFSFQLNCFLFCAWHELVQ